MLNNYKVDVFDDTKEVIDKVNKENIYIEFVRSQEQGFMRFINYINSVVNLLKQKAKVSSFIEIRARIKAIESALRNFDKDKLLDDVFGVEIICANETEIQIIKSELERYFKSTRSKKHDKPNGYKAEHESYAMKTNSSVSQEIAQWNLQGDDVPAVECQFKTIEVELNPEASHHDYKRVDRQAVQSELENKFLIIGKKIPRMWISKENTMQELGYKEIIQKIYPFVDTTTIMEPQKEQIIK